MPQGPDWQNLYSNILHSRKFFAPWCKLRLDSQNDKKCLEVLLPLAVVACKRWINARQLRCRCDLEVVLGEVLQSSMRDRNCLRLFRPEWVQGLHNRQLWEGPLRWRLFLLSEPRKKENHHCKKMVALGIFSKVGRMALMIWTPGGCIFWSTNGCCTLPLNVGIYF